MRALNLHTLCLAAALAFAAAGVRTIDADGADIGGGRPSADPAAGLALDGGQDSGGAPLAGGEIGNGYVRALAETVGNGFDREDGSGARRA